MSIRKHIFMYKHGNPEDRREHLKHILASEDHELDTAYDDLSSNAFETSSHDDAIHDLRTHIASEIESRNTHINWND
jgi:hypothetical protein